MPKESRRVETGRTEGALGSCSRESCQGFFPVPKLVGNHSLGASSPGTCLTPHPVCSGGDRSPCAPRAGGDVLGHPLLQQRLGLSFNCAHSMGLKKVFTFTFPCVWFVIAAEQQAMLWLSRSQHI